MNKILDQLQTPVDLKRYISEFLLPDREKIYQRRERLIADLKYYNKLYNNRHSKRYRIKTTSNAIVEYILFDIESVPEYLKQVYPSFSSYMIVQTKEWQLSGKYIKELESKYGVYSMYSSFL